MLSLQTFRTCVRPLAFALGTSWLVTATGCYSWHAQARPASDVIATAPSSVRITLGTDSTLELRSPRVATDSLVGFVRFVRTDNFNQDSNRVAVPLTSVSRVETRGLNAGRTMLLTIVTTVGTLFFGLLIYCGVDPAACDAS